MTYPCIDLSLPASHLLSDVILKDASERCCRGYRANPAWKLRVPAYWCQFSFLKKKKKNIGVTNRVCAREQFANFHPPIWPNNRHQRSWIYFVFLSPVSHILFKNYVNIYTLNSVPLHAVFWCHLSKVCFDDSRILSRWKKTLICGKTKIFLSMRNKFGVKTTSGTGAGWACYLGLQGRRGNYCRCGCGNGRSREALRVI